MKPAQAALEVLLGLLLASAPALAQPDPVIEEGANIYQNRCKVCHGENGDGQTFAANVLDPPPKNFTSKQSRQELTEERMIQSVTRGRPGTAMMPWENNLTTKQIRAVVHYIRHRFMKLE